MKPIDVSAKDFRLLESKSLSEIAATIPSLDFLACGGKVYVVTGSMGMLERVSGVNGASDDAAWLENKNRPQF